MTKQATKQTKKVRTARLYYGPPDHEVRFYWIVRISDATASVRINSDAVHALTGFKGVTVGCAISNAACDPINKAAFPHPAIIASVTASTIYVVDKVKNGRPWHAVRYAHSYKHLVDKNDSDVLKKMVAEDPALMNRPLTFRVPRKYNPHRSGPKRVSGEERGHNASVIHRGALARAVNAGLISAPAADQMTTTA